MRGNKGFKICSDATNKICTRMEFCLSKLEIQEIRVEYVDAIFKIFIDTYYPGVLKRIEVIVSGFDYEKLIEELLVELLEKLNVLLVHQRNEVLKERELWEKEACMPKQSAMRVEGELEMLIMSLSGLK